MPFDAYIVCFHCAGELASRHGRGPRRISNWPRWRGPEQNGHSAETKLPVKWSDENVVWKTTLPGIGQSSPIIWGERMFLTSYLEKGKERLVFCVDRKSGKIVWQQSAWKGKPEPSHLLNGWASASCVTDGEVVVAFFGIGGIHAYTVDGKRLGRATWASSKGRGAPRLARLWSMTWSFRIATRIRSLPGGARQADGQGSVANEAARPSRLEHADCDRYGQAARDRAQWPRRSAGL